MKDLWKAAFSVGTEWDQLDGIYEFNWDFKNLEDALEEGGMLYGKKVFVFSSAEPQLALYKGVNKIVHVPTVVVIESPLSPSDMVAITSIQSDTEDIIPMKQMKMGWVPYIPFEERAALGHLTEDRIRQFQYCIPYFSQPFDEGAFQRIKFYKFYPQHSPDISGVMTNAFINRYYGNAHQVL